MLGARSTRADVAAWRHGALEVMSRAADLVTGRYGGMERALEVRCRRVDVEVRVWKRAVGVGTRQRRGSVQLGIASEKLRRVNYVKLLELKCVTRGKIHEMKLS